MEPAQHAGNQVWGNGLLALDRTSSSAERRDARAARNRDRVALDHYGAPPCRAPRLAVRGPVRACSLLPAIWFPASGGPRSGRRLRRSRRLDGEVARHFQTLNRSHSLLLLVPRLAGHGPSHLVGVYRLTNRFGRPTSPDLPCVCCRRKIRRRSGDGSSGVG